MSSRDPSSSPAARRTPSDSVTSKDGLDKVELSDLGSPDRPKALPIENDLMQLARLGELRTIQKLFDSGKYNARWTDEQGITPLHWAAINGHYALCHFLLSAGTDVNAKGGDADATPVLWASKRCNLKVVSLLLAHGADPLMRDDQGYNLLHSATLDGNVYQLVMLLHHPDIPVDAPDAQGHTSLMWAAYKGFGACVDILLRWGADVHATDDMGFTALHWALVKGDYMCIQKLVEYGSAFSTRSKPVEGQSEGDTPAMTATKMKSERQWHRALVDSGYDESGGALKFPVPFVNDRRKFYKRFFFLWPFALGGLQLYMLARMLIWIAFPAVLLVGYGLQYLVSKLFRWAPPDMKRMHNTPFLAGIFAATLFWVGVRYVFDIMPWTFFSNILLNMVFIVSYGLCLYFYTLTMIADPGYIPKGGSRGQTKKVIEDLLEGEAFDQRHFCTLCIIRKPLRSKHCRRCGRCVAREDHHCPWVDNCIGVNNHKHFLLYVIALITGIILLIRLTLIYIELLPAPTELHCSILKGALCAQYSKDPLTIVTSSWAALQLTWTFMLLFVHLTQVARNITTYETMKNRGEPPTTLMTAVTTGALSPEGAQVTSPETSSAHQAHNKKKEGCLTQWYKLLGIDTFYTVAFQGYKKRDGRNTQPRNTNPFSRGLLRNCQDFWMDGPVFGHKESGKTLLGGQTVDYTAMYTVPRRGMQYSSPGGAYQAVPTAEEGEM